MLSVVDRCLLMLPVEDASVVARALSLPEVAVSGEVNGTNDKEARPSRLVSRDALGLVWSEVSAEMEGSFFLKLVLPGDVDVVDEVLHPVLPAAEDEFEASELLLFCTSESGCLRGEG